MNVLSLFDGISCGKLALDRANIPVTNYFASEIDKYCIQISKKNHPDIIQLGDIKNIKAEDLPKIDLLIGGSPCQGFSIAGKQLNFNDERSALFFEYIRLLRELKPKYFLLENVKMKKEYKDIITEHLGVNPIEINSSLVSAQNRRRLYWTNIPNISLPKDKGILLKDIIEYGIVDRDKSFCIDSNYHKGGNIKNYFEKSRRQLIFCENYVQWDTNNKGHNSHDQRANYLDCKSGTLRGKQHAKCIYSLTETRTEEAKKIRSEHFKKTGKDFSPRRFKELVPRKDEKSNCLTATFSTKEHIIIDEKYTIRKLTPIECERLQTIPGNYTEGVSNTQRYKMIGNGWTVDIIAHLFRNLLCYEDTEWQ